VRDNRKSAGGVKQKGALRYHSSNWKDGVSELRLTHVTKFLRKLPKLRYAPSKIFARPKVERKKLSNIGYKGSQITDGPGQQECLGPALLLSPKNEEAPWNYKLLN
jgi:hypothetical protein